MKNNMSRFDIALTFLAVFISLGAGIAITSGFESLADSAEREQATPYIQRHQK